MKKCVSLSLILSLGLATFAPALNASQTVRQRIAGAMPSMPAWTKGPGFAAAKKWWKAGRNVNALTSQEQQAFNSLQERVNIGVMIAILTVIFGLVYYDKQGYTYTSPKSFSKGARELVEIYKQQRHKKDRASDEKLLEYAEEFLKLMPRNLTPIKIHNFLFTSDLFQFLSLQEIIEAIKNARNKGLSHTSIREMFNYFINNYRNKTINDAIDWKVKWEADMEKGRQDAARGYREYQEAQSENPS